MPEWKEQDIITFQKLYLKHYGKKITKEESNIRITALVALLNLSIEIQDFRKNNPNKKLSEPD